MKINNEHEQFYKLLGPLFGSRKVQRITKDRFYDDPGKEWIIQFDENNNIISAVSMHGHILKNVFSEDFERTAKDLASILHDIESGTVPSIYRDLYTAAGYEVIKNGVNFVEVKGGYHV